MVYILTFLNSELAVFCSIKEKLIRVWKSRLKLWSNQDINIKLEKSLSHYGQPFSVQYEKEKVINHTEETENTAHESLQPKSKTKRTKKSTRTG